jgi:hypothetical protein
VAITGVTRNTYIILEVKPFRKCQVVTQRGREDNIKMDLQDISFRLGGGWY